MLTALTRLRSLVRASEIGLTLLGVLTGIMGGLGVFVMGALADACHILFFGLAPGSHLSSADTLSPYASLVPILGGVAVGLSNIALRRWRPKPMVDAIEANALHGGTMSGRDSLILSGQTILSNGFGASVGLEAGYTQLGAALASKLGQKLHLRRADLRLLVGCGAAAAIAAAFNAPLTGAFYAFELIIGSYTIGAIAPVLAAAIAAKLTVNAIHPGGMLFAVNTYHAGSAADYLSFIFLGFACGLLGIGLMRAVTFFEKLITDTQLPLVLRPALGGAVVGALALITPQVLSGGHGALQLNMLSDIPLATIALLFLLKATATTVTLGSGFRGGLFFAALMLGTLAGKLAAGLALLAFPALSLDPNATAVIAMSALTVAVIGGPLTMAFLALETTGDVVITGFALTAAVVASLTVRELFGYSFSTWRLHLRGESIRSAQDVGWIRSLTVAKLMQSNLTTVDCAVPLAAFRKQYPLGAQQTVVATQGSQYAGIVWVSDAYAQEGAFAAASTVQDLLHHTATTLLPGMNVKQALKLFDETASEALAVVKSPETLHVIGFLTEAHALRRYAEELDQARRSLAGEA